MSDIMIGAAGLVTLLAFILVGVPIAASMAIVGTLFTLFVVPAVYVMLAADHSKKRGAIDPVEAPAAGD